MKQEKILLCVLIALCLSFLNGCSKTKTVYVPVPIRQSAECAEPLPPVLPPINPEDMLDSMSNGELLGIHNNLIHQYIKGLKATILCYKKEIINEPN